MEKLMDLVRRYVSPVFLVMLVASFVLWYIAKLSYTYTTDHRVHLNVDGVRFEVTCVVEGTGTNLFGHQVYMRKRLNVPLSDLRYEVLTDEGQEDKLRIDPQSLQNVLSLKFSDIKIIAIRSVPEIDDPRKAEE